MTPAARVAAAIEVLDRIVAGAPADRTLTTWARRYRFAGAGDRAAIRDHVFDALRCRRSYAALGGAETGRGLMIGAVRAAQGDPATIFTGAGYAPPALTADEKVPPPAFAELPRNVACDVPDWLAPRLVASLGADCMQVLRRMRHRAPVFLRVNLLKTTPAKAAARLREEAIATRPHPLSDTALEVTRNARRVRASGAFAEGLVEMQDAASQAAADLAPVTAGTRALDFCAGGGGKSLALAGRGAGCVFAHDADPDRMRDLPARSARAGAPVTLLAAEALKATAPFDLVLADVPCSGSGIWRRDPEAKWRLTPDGLDRLTREQAAILDTAAGLVDPHGALLYATCSLLDEENAVQVRAFCRRWPSWRCREERRFTPIDGADGFYAALLARENEVGKTTGNC